MILESASHDWHHYDFDWSCLDWTVCNFCSVSKTQYLYEPCDTYYVDSTDSLKVAIRAIEEEALMYFVNELPRGKDIELKHVDLNDIVVASQYTPGVYIDEMYAPAKFGCWVRNHSHKGDMYDDVDLVLKCKSDIHDIRIPVALQLHFCISAQAWPIGAARLSFAVLTSDAEKLDFGEYTVHRLKHDKKASTLDILFGMQ